MTNYRNTNGDNLLDVALEIMGAGVPIQIRRTTAEGESEYAVGVVTSAYHNALGKDDGGVTSITVGGIPLRVHVTDEWDIVAHDSTGSVTGRSPLPEVFVNGYMYPVVEPGEPLPDSSERQIPVTEGQWQAEHQYYEGAGEYEPSRPVLVDWMDPTETPSECILRLNTEVHEASQRESAALNRRPDRPHWQTDGDPILIVAPDTLVVDALRWHNGSPVGHHEAIVIRRVTADTWLVTYTLDRYESFAVGVNIRATPDEHKKLYAMEVAGY